MEYTAITFALIRKKNADLNFDNIEDITLICLDNCNLASVNNLELFSHIQELHLHHNKISLIENISYFKSLKYLDLSFNTISEEGLLQSLANIPKGLGSINLTGNPCAVDDGALSVLQDTFPDLGIIIDTVDEITGSKAENNFDEEIETKPSLVLDDIDHSRPLNADNVLKAIVDRKCKLQSISTCNIDATILELNNEFDSAVSSMKNKRDRRVIDISHCEESVHESIADRTASLIERNNLRKKEAAMFMSALREKSLQYIDAKKV